MEPETTTEPEGGVAVLDDPEAGLSAGDNRELIAAAGDGEVVLLPDAALAGYDRQTRELIDEMETEARAAEDKYLALKAQAAEAKKIFEGMAAELRQLIRKRREQRGRPPEKDLFTAAGGGVVDAEYTVTPGDADPLENLWREYPLSRWTAFGLTAKQIDKLGSAGISTVGDLADYTRPNDSGWSKKLTDVAGVGKGTAEKIEEANLAFFAEWNRVLRDKFAEEKGVLRVADPGDEQGAAQPGGGDAAPPEVDQPGDDAGAPDQGEGDRGEE